MNAYYKYIFVITTVSADLSFAFVSAADTGFEERKVSCLRGEIVNYYVRPSCSASRADIKKYTPIFDELYKENESLMSYLCLERHNGISEENYKIISKYINEYNDFSFKVAKIFSKCDFSEAAKQSSNADSILKKIRDIIMGKQQQRQLSVSSASQQGNAVEYSDSAGNTFRKIGGTLSWRLNNPGNVVYGPLSSNSSIGKYYDQASNNTFAIYPDEETGMNAMRNLLLSDKYNGMTIDEAIKTYAPSMQNNTAAYQDFVNKNMSIPDGSQVRIKDLSSDQFNKLTDIIKRYEGWKPGNVVGGGN